MTQANVTMTVRDAGNVASIIDIKGDITGFAESVLMDAYREATVDGASNVILNFDGLDYMNSGGIGLIVTLLIRANRQNQKLLAVGLSDHYKHIFKLTKIDEAIQIFESESQALRQAGN